MNHKDVNSNFPVIIINISSSQLSPNKIKYLFSTGKFKENLKCQHCNGSKAVNSAIFII